jgi:curved DNA-binding protein CbpA
MPSDPSNGDRMYRRLDVAPEASAEQIGRAYRRLAHSLHPDAHPEAPDAAVRFREITEAYEILSNPARRARYDRDRPPSTADDVGPRRRGANPHTTIPLTPRQTPGRPANQPTAIGLGPFETGSAPLIAGPVHVDSPSNPHRAASGRASRTDLEQLIDGVLRAWRWW